jgi:hypothetical protein
MPIPGFTAEASLGKSRRAYHGRYLFAGTAADPGALAASVLPGQMEVTEDLDYEDEVGVTDVLDVDVDEDLEAATPLEDGDLENGAEENGDEENGTEF